MDTIKKHGDNFLKIYEIFGLLDSMISIASYRESLNYYTIPQFYERNAGNNKRLSFTEAFHPLVKEPVPNSICIEKPVLLTGSNASGKSTFLKTVAINAIFAQTIHTSLAREYSSCFFNIYSSMALKDDLLKNESYYITEIKSLKRIVDSVSDDIPLLCFIDEVLRGTNTIERIAASSQVLHHLSSGNCLCIAATHDIELTSMLSESFDNYHFQESFSGDEITFDYKLYAGKSNTRNAIKLLKVMGYPLSIVNNAEKAAEVFMNEGKWSVING
jgi:DNA mismatch repair ATPase MutS